MDFQEDREMLFEIIFDLHQSYLNKKGVTWRAQINFDPLGDPIFDGNSYSLQFNEQSHPIVCTSLLFYFLIQITEALHEHGIPEEQLLDRLNPNLQIPKKFIFKTFNLRIIK